MFKAFGSRFVVRGWLETRTVEKANQWRLIANPGSPTGQVTVR